MYGKPGVKEAAQAMIEGYNSFPCAIYDTIDEGRGARGMTKIRLGAVLVSVFVYMFRTLEW